MELNVLPCLNLTQIQDNLDSREIMAKHYAYKRDELKGFIERLRWEMEEVQSAMTEAEAQLALVEAAAEQYQPLPLETVICDGELPF